MAHYSPISPYNLSPKHVKKNVHLKESRDLLYWEMSHKVAQRCILGSGFVSLMAWWMFTDAVSEPLNVTTVEPSDVEKIL